jgi:hypothetical protein
MPELKSADAVYLVIAFIVPGLIMVFVRSQMTTGRMSPPKESYLIYFTLSIIYYAIIFPFIIQSLRPHADSFFAMYISWLLIILIIPFELGLLMGFDARFGWIRRMFSRLGLSVVIHAIPTAWDYKFLQLKYPEFVLVTLKDGTKFAGFLGAGSFISSDQSERDLYLEKVYDLDEHSNWIDKGDQRLLIAAGGISTIQFWPNTNQGDNHGADQ